MINDQIPYPRKAKQIAKPFDVILDMILINETLLKSNCFWSKIWGNWNDWKKTRNDIYCIMSYSFGSSKKVIDHDALK